MNVKNNNQHKLFDLHYYNKNKQSQTSAVNKINKKKEQKKYLQMYKEHKDLIKYNDKKKISWNDITNQNYKHFLLDNPNKYQNEYEINNVLFNEQIENLDPEEEELLQHLTHNNKCDDDVKEQKISEVKECNKNKKMKINGISVDKISSNNHKNQFASKDENTKNKEIINRNKLVISKEVVTHKKVRDNTVKRNDYYKRKFEESHKNVEDEQQKKVINVIQKLEKKRIKLNM